jgi:hypothetical protein
MARKEKKYHFIYKTTNILSGRYYIGMHSTDNLDDGYLGSGNRLRLAIRKYGKDSFKREILEFCENREELKKLEKEVVTLDEISKKECMNLTVGGEGGWFTDIHNKAFKIKIKEDFELLNKFKLIGSNNFKIAHKNGKIKYNTFEKKTHSEETKRKMSQSSKGNGSGETNSQYGTCWITKDGTNKKIKKEDVETYLLEGWTNGREVYLKGSDIKTSKLTEENVLNIKRILNEGFLKQNKIAEMFNVKQETISKIKRNIIWEHLVVID